MEFLVSNFEQILFYIFAAMTVAGAVGVVTLKNPVHSAISLLATFLCVAVLFILRHAEFLAAVQVMVYAGGIMVLFLFVIMMVRAKDLTAEKAFLSHVAPMAVVGGVLIGALLSAGILLGVLAVGDGGTEALRMVEQADGMMLEKGNTEAVGQLLYTQFLVPFEILSVVLLVAMIGAIVFGRRDRFTEAGSEEA